MKKTKFVRVVALVLACLTMFGITGISAAASDDGDYTVTYDWKQIRDILNAVSYSSYAATYREDNVPVATEEIVIDVLNDINTGKTTAAYQPLDQYATVNAKNDLLNLEGSASAVYLPDSGMVTWNVEIPEKALYGVRIIYCPVSSNVSSIERILYLNGLVPFSEARSISMTKTWNYAYNEKDGQKYYPFDVNGNDMRSSVDMAAPAWYTYNTHDSNGFSSEDFQYVFNKGTNTLALSASRESVAIKAIILYPVEKVKTYDEYISEMTQKYGDANPSDDAAVKLEAELPSYVSDTSIYASSDRTSSLNTSNSYNSETGKVENVKNSPSSELLNVIGASSYNTVGQWAAYEFTVSESGFYNIVMRYKQSVLEGMFVSRSVKIMGGDYGDYPTVPFAEAHNARFPFSKDWQASAINNGGDPFKFYFEKGVTYTVYFEVSLGDLAETIGTVQNVLSKINASYLNIVKLTGPTPDEYRTYNFSKIMPGTITDLLESAQILEQVSKKIQEICGTSGSMVVTLDNVSRLLDKMGRDPETEIAANLNELKTNIGTLGTWINDVKSQSMTVDFLSVQSETTKLPKDDANFFQAAWFEISAFFQSFFVDYNAMGVEDAGNTSATIDVWLAYGRDQSKIWRSLINDDFTKKTNIAVTLKLVTTTTLLPSVLAGTGPDAYIGLASADTINYAIRGAINPLNEFDGIDTMLDGTYFNEAALTPISLYGDVYGIPETMAFDMMFVRLDTLVEEELEIPETWDDIMSINTVLVSKNMEIGLPYQTIINEMIYQQGESIWKYEEEGGIYAGSQIAYGDDLQIQVFDKVVRLYTDYSFPYAYNATNRFRTGELPIFVGDYVTNYNTLMIFGTEIKGLWSMTVIPGTKQADGSVDHTTVATVTSTLMLSGSKNKDAAWEFIKWQTSSSSQSKYGNEMVALIGPSAKYATANKDAIKNLSWSSDEYNNIMAQFNQVAAIPNYPGNYILTRYIQFAFLDAYNDGEDPAYAMKSYVNTINKEINRKREEFNLPIIHVGGTLEGTLAE